MSDVVPETKIFVVGQSVIQNELLTQCIESSIGCPTVAYSELDQISTDEIKKQRALMLLDYKDRNFKIMFSDFIQSVKASQSNCLVALLNVKQEGCGSERQLKKSGIQGIFFEDTPSDILIKGIKALLKEGIWSPRYLMKEGFSDDPHNESELTGFLSSREKQILKLIVSGFTNDMIANELCLKFNTVKSHIYNIYKKINVHNRLQVVRWYKVNYPDRQLTQ